MTTVSTRPRIKRFLRFRDHAFLLIGILSTTFQTPASETPDFRAEKLQEIDVRIEKAIALGQLPGGVLWIERGDKTHLQTYGHRALAPEKEPMTADTLFDAASLTKVVATTASIMKLVEGGKLNLEVPLNHYLPRFCGHGKEEVTLRHLLTHTSGLPPVLPYQPDWNGYENALKLAYNRELRTAPGSTFRYSDVNFILLGELVRHISGRPLDQYAKETVFKPLGMVDTGFNPPARKRSRIAPTTQLNGKFLRGVVHDPSARRMQGVAGHAGLFLTAKDLARFARMILNQGSAEQGRFFQSKTVEAMTTVQTAASISARRGLGWDIDSPYASPRGNHFPVGSFGHTGWTGGSLWIDPFSKTIVIFLSNRNHPTEDGSVVALRRDIATLVAEAIPDFNFAYVPTSLPTKPKKKESNARPSAADSMAPVMIGADRLNEIELPERVGLITNHTGQNAQRIATIDLLNDLEDSKLTALFSPEHGIRGLLDEKVEDGIDEQTGLPIYSLYGKKRAPTQEQLAKLDALVFDIQDIGCRFYTYISTMGLAMEAAAKAGIPFYVLDRVNPINGLATDGPVFVDTEDFVGFHPIPLRHGMTVGELALMFKIEKKIDVDLHIVPLKNWRRAQWFDQTQLPWTNPSPNMRSLTEGILYPGVGLIEFANVSVGRGTDTPFEVVGAPYVNDLELAKRMNAQSIPGVRFVPIRFKPKSSKFAHETCGGVNIILTDRDLCPVVDIGLTLAATLRKMYPETFQLERVGRLLKNPDLLKQLSAGAPTASIREAFTPELNDFRQRRRRYLLY